MAEVKFVSTTREDQNAKIVVEVKFVSTTRYNKPLKYNKPSLEEVAQRLHYTYTQPMWASENMPKCCQYISD